MKISPQQASNSSIFKSYLQDITLEGSDILIAPRIKLSARTHTYRCALCACTLNSYTPAPSIMSNKYLLTTHIAAKSIQNQRIIQHLKGFQSCSSAKSNLSNLFSGKSILSNLFPLKSNVFNVFSLKSNRYKHYARREAHRFQKIFYSHNIKSTRISSVLHIHNTLTNHFYKNLLPRNMPLRTCKMFLRSHAPPSRHTSGKIPQFHLFPTNKCQFI